MPGRFVAAAGCAVAIALMLAPGCTNTQDDALGKRQSALDFELEVIAVDDAVGGDTHTPEDDTTPVEDVEPVDDTGDVDDVDDVGDVDDNSTDAGGEPDAMPDAIGPDGESPDTGEPDSSEPDATVDAGEPDAGEPDTGEPDAGEPDTLSDTTDPDTTEPDTGEPDTSEPDTTSDTGEPDTSEPDTTSDTGEPDTSEPDTTSDTGEPDTSEPDTTSDTGEPDTSEPDTTSDTGQPDTGQPDTGSPDTTSDTGEPDTTPPECTEDADCADTDACNGAETCDMGSCKPGTAIDCQDGDLCNGEEVCDPTDGSCSAGDPLDCDDGEYCTIDGCNANTGCTHTPRDCDDLNPCTEDTCSNSGGSSSGSPGETGSGSSGSCDYKAIDGACNDGDPCTLNDSCQQGQCYGGEPKCVDGVDCTIDGCNPADGSCSYIPSDSACNDGDACNGEEVCTPAGCVPGGPVDCDDGLECTEDSCSGGMCQHEDIPDKCECTEQPQTPVSYSVDITLGKGGQDNSGFFLPDDFKCPALGGSVGASFVLKIDGQTTAASCANAKEGDKTCKESASLTGKTELAFKLCKETVKFTGSLGHTHKKEVCLECDDNCEQTCGDEGCIRDDYDLKIGASYSKFYGVDTSTEKSFFKIAFKCGASIGGGVNAGGNYFDKEREEGFDCAECEECTGAGISLGVDLAGSAGCNISVAGPLGFGFSVGLANIAALNVGLYGGGSGESGECQGKACGFIGIDFKLQINGTPLPCINLGWLGSFGIRCGGFVKGCAEGNICTSGTSSYTNRCPNGWGLTPGFGCNVGSCR